MKAGVRFIIIMYKATFRTLGGRVLARHWQAGIHIALLSH